MNPDTNEFEPVKEMVGGIRRRFFDNEPVPDDWPVFTLGQEVTLKGYRWKVETCEEATLTFTAVGPLSKGQQLRNKAKRQRRKSRQR